MLWYRIQGAYLTTGKDVDITIEAADRRSAELWAKKNRVAVSALAEISYDQLPTAQEVVPEESSDARSGLEDLGTAAHSRRGSGYRPAPRKSGIGSLITVIVATVAAVGIAIGLVVHFRSSKPQPAVGSISGAAWLSQNGGASNIQRGLKVSVIRALVAGPPVVQCLEDEISLWKSRAESDEKDAADWRHVVPDDTEGVASRNNDAKRDRQMLAAIQATIAQLPADNIAVADAHALLTKFDYFGFAPFGAIVADALVTAEKTDVDGKYIIEGIPEGDYFLYAEIATKVLLVQWLVPVHVSASKALKVDLSNDNAFIVVNIP